MKGTAILFNDNLTITFIENVDEDTFNDLLKEISGTEEAQKNKKATFPEQSFWHEEEIDWEYGY